jgi:hypothetical protein
VLSSQVWPAERSRTIFVGVVFGLVAHGLGILTNRNLDALLSEALAEPSAFNDTREFLGRKHLKNVRKGGGEHRTGSLVDGSGVLAAANINEGHPETCTRLDDTIMTGGAGMAHRKFPSVRTDRS